MKINSSVPSVSANDTASRPKATVSAGRTASGSAPEQVELSSLSNQLQDMGSLTGGSQVIDAARVAEIKQAISEGRFSIDAGRIADGLIESVRDMLARQQG